MQSFYLLLKRIYISIFVLSVFFCGSNVVFAQQESIDSLSSKNVYIMRGELETIKVYGLTRISLVDPSVADISDTTENEVTLIGQASGETTLFLWDNYGKRKLTITVFEKDLELIKERIQTLLEKVDIKGVSVEINKAEGKVVVTGGVPDYKSAQFDEILLPFSDQIIRLTEAAASQDMVRVDLQVTELNETLSKSLGINWSTGGRSGITPSYQETVPSFDGTVEDFFKIGDFSRTGQLIAAINALITEGKGRVLSNPKLVVVSGEEASFLVGGEIPISTTTVTEGSVQQNVSFRAYGISMSVTPTVRKDKIDIVVDFEVSDVDAANAVGSNVAFTTRTAQTHLLLEHGQTVVLAGLIKQNQNVSVTKIPFLGDIPIIGLLFRNKTTPTTQQDQEVVISLTPFVLDKKGVGSLKSFKKIHPQDLTERLSGDVPLEKPQSMPGVSAALQNQSSANGISSDMLNYIRRVQEQIAKATIYPREAQSSGWEGTVKLGLLILKDGTLALASVKESSGHEIFDQAALKTARDVAPYSQFPTDGGLQEINVTVPIVYSLNK